MKKILFLILVALSSSSFAISPEERAQLLELTNNGNSEAMYASYVDVGERGNSAKKPSEEEHEQVKKWLLKAGELNNWRAAFALELCYRKGCLALEPNSERSQHFKSVYETQP